MKNVVAVLVILFITTCLLGWWFLLSNNKSIADQDIGQAEPHRGELDANMGGMPDYKPVIAANEVLHLKADDYVSAIPAESIMSNESDHEKYLASLFSSLKQISNMSDVFPFYGEDGVYLSKVPIYYFDVIDNKVGNIVYFAVFTKDFSKAASVNFYLMEPDFEGEGKRREICSDIQAIWEHEKLLIEEPDKLYIALLNAGITFLIDSDNNIHNKSLGKADIKIEGDYYHALDYDKLAVSYAKIADRDNLVWIDFNN